MEANRAQVRLRAAEPRDAEAIVRMARAQGWIAEGEEFEALPAAPRAGDGSR